MRAIRSSDGSSYPITHLKPSTSAAEFFDALSAVSSIPVLALIVMHPSGRQVDNESITALLKEPEDVESQERTAYLFDREILNVDLQGAEGQQLYEALQIDKERVLEDTHGDPTKQANTSLELIACIRNQHASLSAALQNLERHRGGRQEAINAYSLFASPNVTNYRNLLAVYPAAISLVNRIRIPSKAHHLAPPTPVSDAGTGNASQSLQPTSRLLSEFVSQEKMASVRDGCKKVFDDLERKNSDLENILKEVSSGTEELRVEGNLRAEMLEDLVEAEKDAREATERLLELYDLFDAAKRGGRSVTAEEEQELRALEEEAVERLSYLVDRKNDETSVLLHSLQRIAGLQSHIASMTDMIRSINEILRTKCDAFKHLTRLQLLVPSYAATLAESVRRKMYSRLLGANSLAFAENCSRFMEEEKNRRRVYQGEWAGKLPWEIPGLEESIPNVEVEVRNSNVLGKAGGDAKSAKTSSDTTGNDLAVEDLDDLEKALKEIDDDLTPEDMPPSGVLHPARESLTLIRKLRKQIEELQADFDKLSKKLEIADEVASDEDGQQGEHASGGTSVNISAAGDVEQIRLLEERRQERERELQAERTAREQEQTEMSVNNAKMQKAFEDLKEEHRLHRENAATETNRLQGRLSSLESQLEAAQSERDQFESEKTSLASRLEALQVESRTRQDELEELEDKYDLLADERRNLLAELGERDRHFRDFKAETEVDRATLEKELQEEKERTALQVAAVQQRLAEETDNRKAKEEEVSKLGWEVSQIECQVEEEKKQKEERGKALEEKTTQYAVMEGQVSTLLELVRDFHGTHLDLLTSFIDDPLPIIAPSANSTSAKSTTTQSSDRPHPVTTSSALPASAMSTCVSAYTVPTFSFSDLASAITSFETQRENSILLQGLFKEKTDACAYQTKKWQQQCKRYKVKEERAIKLANEKLSFRGFYTGDLALFLPTRNAKVGSGQTFAAFNYGRPNYFLQPTGPLIRDVQTREWIIARITSISEAVVDESDAGSTNPYSLPKGSKYFMLEAEPWTRQGSSGVTAGAPAQGTTTRQATQNAGTSGEHVTTGADAGASPPTESRVVSPAAATAGMQPSLHSRSVSASAIPPTSSELPSASPLPTAHISAATQVGFPVASIHSGSVMASSAFSMIDSTTSGTSSAVNRPVLSSSMSSPATSDPHRPSGLSVHKPANLDPVQETVTPAQHTILLPEPSTAASAAQDAQQALVSRSLGEAAPAFLPKPSTSASAKAAVSSASPIATSSTANPGGNRQFSTSLPRSHTSNDSNSATSSLYRKGSASFLGSASGMGGNGKAPATTSTTLSNEDNDKAWASATTGTSNGTFFTGMGSDGPASPPQPTRSASTPLRQTQTIGRYTGRKSAAAGRQANISSGSASVRERTSSSSGAVSEGARSRLVSSSSAADLLRSLTIDHI